MDTTTLFITVAVVGLVLYRQFSGGFVRPGNRDVVLPVVVLALGVTTLTTAAPPVTATGVALLAGELVLAAALGVLRGRAFRLEARDGLLYRRGSVALLVGWVLTIGLRLVAGAVGTALGAGPLLTSTTTLVFGAGLLLQGFVLRNRVAASGIPVGAPARRRSAA
ncbi:hypothetical protein [Pseudonocardia sp. HH130630-07]|uniref:hypothetical protein n=1 Tax=Pseudonocardia sp. HH130630-07 TaxID=1690815 RepID=UPI0008150FD5|nr:hypothetical protein [Pseudonocardia sp. HH130630-07]ANY07539.1 hypothetical protein AFB00_15960 [Pseudonocardia sp. HH130630-07]